jgi:hypothetical protein
MQTFEAFGLRVQSEVALLGVPESAGPPDVVVRRRALSREELQALVTDDQLCWGSVQGLVSFVVKGGDEIVVDPRGEVGEELLGSFVAGILMAILLRQRGLFTLHASCVARGDFAVAFAGDSGCGKSTLAEYFRQSGYRFLCDDLLALRMEDAPMVVPGYPHLRLTQEAGTRFVDEFEALPELPSHRGKRLRAVEHSAAEPVPLRRLYVLDAASAPETSVEPLSSGEAFREIPQHAWATNTIADVQSKATYLHQCAALIKAVPVARLHRVRTLDALGAHLDAVERDLGRASASDA